MKPARLGVALAVVIALGVVAFAVPLPASVEAAALIQVEADQVTRVTAPDCGGFLTELPTRDGQEVREGDVLAVLTNPKLEVARCSSTRPTRLCGGSSSGTRSPACRKWRRRRAGPAADRVRAAGLLREHAALSRQRGQLVLRRRGPGWGRAHPALEQVGRWVEPGAEVCRVGNDRALRAVLLVGPAEREQVRAGAAARLRVHGCGSATAGGRRRGRPGRGGRRPAATVPPGRRRRPDPPDPASRKDARLPRTIWSRSGWGRRTGRSTRASWGGCRSSARRRSGGAAAATWPRH